MPLDDEVTTKRGRTRADQRRQLRKRFDALRDEVYKDYINEVEEDTRFYELEFAQDTVPEEWTGKGIKPVVPPTAYNAIENAADHILTTPRIRVPVRPTEENQREEQTVAERKRAALRFFWQLVEVEEGDPLSAGTKSLVKDGKIVLKKLIRWNLIPDEVDENPIGLDGFVWDITSIPGETVFEDPDRPHDPWFVYETFQVRVRTAKARYPDATGPWRNKKDTDLVPVVEYWEKPKGKSQGRFVVWIDETAVVDEINPYHWQTNRHTRRKPDFTGYVPYHIRPSGWGETKAELNPEKLYVGLLRRMRSLLTTQASHMTDATTQLKISTFPPTIGTGVTEDQKLEVGPGKMIRLTDPQQKLEILRWPELQASLFQMLSLIQDQANQLSKLGSLGGTPLSGVDTATEADQIVRNAAAKLVRPVNALRALVTAVNKQMLQDIDLVLAQPVTLFGSPDVGAATVTLRPEDIDGFYQTTVELGTTDQAALDGANSRLWIDAYRSLPGLSEETAMENMGVQDPQAEMMQREEENIFRSPQHQQLRVLASLIAMGDAGNEILEATRRQMAQNPDEMGGEPEGTGDALSMVEQPAGAAGDGLRAAGQQQTRDQRPDLANQ